MRTSKTAIALAGALATVAVAFPAARLRGCRALLRGARLGGMGFHDPNPALMDLTVDAAKPELLLYAPKKTGGLKLVAVEYFVPYIGQPAPELFGQRFDGPMAGHAPEIPAHYDLHVWL